MKDWTQGSKGIYSTHGASNHSETERESHDYYATSPEAVDVLLQHETFSPVIWECACGEGHISKALIQGGTA